jgi:hypothetical protein
MKDDAETEPLAESIAQIDEMSSMGDRRTRGCLDLDPNDISLLDTLLPSC